MTTQMIQDIFYTCLLPLIGILCSYGIMFLNKKTKEIQKNVDNDLFAKYSDMLVGIVETCVIATNQTYVNKLKAQDGFGIEQQKEAFKQTYEAIRQLMTEEMVVVLNEAYGDVTLLINKLIEEQVNVIKFTREN